MRSARAPRRDHDLRSLAGASAPQKGFRWRRPRHSLKGRQDPSAVEQARSRLDGLKRRAEAGEIDRVFPDESDALTHPYLARCWAKRGAELRIDAPGQAKCRAMLGAFDPARRTLIVRTSATKRSSDFMDLLDHLSAVYSARGVKPLVADANNGPIHTSTLTTQVLAERSWIRIAWLPKYAPELNNIEHRWRDIKQHQPANWTFADADDLDRTIHQAVDRLNQERQPHPSYRLLFSAVHIGTSSTSAAQ